MPDSTRRTWIYVLADIGAIYWILCERIAAFAAERKRSVDQLQVGDVLLLYATGKVATAKGQLFGSCVVEGPQRVSQAPFRVDAREFPLEYRIELARLAPLGEGIMLREVVPRLRAFEVGKQPNSWTAVLRRPLVALDSDDAQLLRHALYAQASPATDALVATYAPPASRAPD
jgi:hypothetical protein